MEKICQVLEGHQMTLLKDIAILDKMYDQNLVYFKELSMYILAGKKKLKEVREQELPQLTAKARLRDCRRTLRPPKIWRDCATGLRRKSMIWS